MIHLLPGRPILSPVILLAFCLSAPAVAQDTIALRDESTGRVSRFQGQVVAWDAEFLRYEANGRQRQIRSDRVIDVAYPRTEAHLEADQQFEQGQFIQAYQSYANAVADEPREWVKRELLAGQLRCARAIDPSSAETLVAFFGLFNANSQTRFFHLIPLSWEMIRPGEPAGFDRWIDSQSETQSLIGASWMLPIDEERSVARLRQLANSADSRIAHLATAQLWRPQTIAAKPEDVQRWRAAIDRMPGELQAGPRYLLALTKKRNEQAEAAAIAMLQIPILFPGEYQLSGSALLEAHNLLSSSGRDREATIVLAELQRDFGFSRAALKSGARIENLDQ
ncbi:MAG: hypothetical protein ACR2NP_20920 [Pirellulaceae bacterium]